MKRYPSRGDRRCVVGLGQRAILCPWFNHDGERADQADDGPAGRDRRHSCQWSDGRTEGRWHRLAVSPRGSRPRGGWSRGSGSAARGGRSCGPARRRGRRSPGHRASAAYRAGRLPGSPTGLVPQPRSPARRSSSASLRPQCAAWPELGPGRSSSSPCGAADASRRTTGARPSPGPCGRRGSPVTRPAGRGRRGCAETRPRPSRPRRARGDAQGLALAVLVDRRGGRIAARPPIRPTSGTFTSVASGRTQGQAPASGRVRQALTRVSISAQGRLAPILDMPPAPIALAGSSAERVGTPWTQTARMTAFSAVSAVRRGSRKPGTQPSFLRLGSPPRVSASALRGDPPGPGIPVRSRDPLR